MYIVFHTPETQLWLLSDCFRLSACGPERVATNLGDQRVSVGAFWN